MGATARVRTGGTDAEAFEQVLSQVADEVAAS